MRDWTRLLSQVCGSVVSAMEHPFSHFGAAPHYAFSAPTGYMSGRSSRDHREYSTAIQAGPNSVLGLPRNYECGRASPYDNTHYSPERCASASAKMPATRFRQHLCRAMLDSFLSKVSAPRRVNPARQGAQRLRPATISLLAGHLFPRTADAILEFFPRSLVMSPPFTLGVGFDTRPIFPFVSRV